MDLYPKHKAAWDAAAGAPYQNRNQISYLAALLPFIEQQAIFSSILENSDTDYDRANANYINTYSGSVGGVPTHWAAKISAFICPSDPEGTSAGANDTGLTSYHCNYGDAWESCYMTPTGTSRISRSRGAFTSGLSVVIGFSGISDGTSNTVFLSEVAIGPRGGTRKMKGGIATNLGSQQPSNCFAYRGGNGEYASGATVWEGTGNQHTGRRWGAALPSYTMFNTIFPPNSTSCSLNANFDNYDNVVTVSSYHTGGVNLSMGDGSVRFLSETIDAKNFNTAIWSTTSLSGAIYGVWSELGSRSGGESASMP